MPPIAVQPERGEPGRHFMPQNGDVILPERAIEKDRKNRRAGGIDPRLPPRSRPHALVDPVLHRRAAYALWPTGGTRHR
ncbi:hypothetical protein ACTI_24750 [Actinoplanes sp. OR16]|nr:hypothetical protein ACTI_24750 [Actinoplanes sp. OR16]